jgi:hypothetical protein
VAKTTRKRKVKYSFSQEETDALFEEAERKRIKLSAGASNEEANNE